MYDALTVNEARKAVAGACRLERVGLRLCKRREHDANGRYCGGNAERAKRGKGLEYVCSGCGKAGYLHGGIEQDLRPLRFALFVEGFFALLFRFLKFLPF